METVRIDKWLAAVRIFKTRTAAAEACTGGKVKINGTGAKPSSPVRVGDLVEARVGRRQRVAVVHKLIEKRVAAPVAAECYEDRSPSPDPSLSNAPTGRREPGAGRPTKRDRRKLRQFRGR